MAFVLLRETYEPFLLEKWTAILRKETNIPHLHHRHSNNISRKQRFSRAIIRPLAMLITSPIVLLTSIYVGLAYGYTYLLFTSFGTLFTRIYGFSESTVGLTYLGFGVGCALGLFILGAVSDRLVQHFSMPGAWMAEYRLLPLLPGSLIIPIGLLWYGWTAEAKTHWILPIVGSGIVGLGTLAVFMPVQSYLIDAFPLHAASAAAANTILRCLAGAFLPLAGPSLYQSLGQGWGNTVLAFVAVAFTPISWIAFKYGERIRTTYPGKQR